MHVILAIDGSPTSQQATQVLANLPWASQPTVTVVTALQDAHRELMPSEASQRMEVAEEAQAMEFLEAAVALLTPHCESVNTVMDRAHPRNLILEVAKQKHADLIVAGTTGHSAAYRVVIGSTADYIVNHAKCSVLIVREAEATGLASAKDFRLLSAYDGSQESEEAFRQLCSFDWPADKTSLHMTTMLEKPKLLPDDVVYDADQIRECETVLRTKTAESPCTTSEISVHETIHIGACVHEVASKQESNLLFIGGTGKSAVARFFLGSTSRYILHHSPCSIWIARSKQW